MWSFHFLSKLVDILNCFVRLTPISFVLRWMVAASLFPFYFTFTSLRMYLLHLGCTHIVPSFIAVNDTCTPLSKLLSLELTLTLLLLLPGLLLLFILGLYPNFYLRFRYTYCEFLSLSLLSVWTGIAVAG